MANICLDSQIFFTSPVAAGPKPTSQVLWVQNEDPSVASSGGPKTPRRDTYDPRRGVPRTSDDAVLISSDDESDSRDLDDGRSDTSFPPIEELLRQPARRTDVESSSLSGAGMYPFSISRMGH